MGFAVNYKLEIADHPEWLSLLITLLEQMYPSKYGMFDKDGDYIGVGLDMEDIIQRIEKLSTYYQTIIFHLYISDEDDGLDVAYIQNNKHYIQPAIITYPKFDMNKLK